jgi:hypothetical protein
MPETSGAAPKTRSSPAFVLVAGGGAVAFAGSLTFFLYAYLVRFGDVAAGTGIRRPVATDIVLFSVFALHHSLFARTALKRWVQRIAPAELERSFYTWIASALFAAVCWWWMPVPGDLYTLNGVWRGAGLLVQAMGLVLTFLGARALDVLDLAGVRSIQAARSAPIPLVTSGAFALVRHPLYLGWALFTFGAPHMTPTRGLFAVVSTAYLALAIPWEERGLVGTFGAQYEAYRLKTRWRMLPGLY